MKALQADITRLKVDAIVTAANPWLRGGGGVDGAIHDAAGPQLLEACLALNGCQRGQAKITPGFCLPAKYVIHAVGPIWTGGTNDEPAILASCYSASLNLALEYDLKSIAFPSIGTGAYSYPIENAAAVAVSACDHFLRTHGQTISVIFCCFTRAELQVYERILGPEGGFSSSGS